MPARSFFPEDHSFPYHQFLDAPQRRSARAGVFSAADRPETGGSGGALRNATGVGRNLPSRRRLWRGRIPPPPETGGTAAVLKASSKQFF